MATNQAIYRKYILELVDKVTEEYTYPQKKHYNIEVAKLRSEREVKYTMEQVNSGVSRALDWLSRNSSSPLIRYKNFFLPNKEKYLFEKLSQEYYEYLLELIKVEEKVCLISHNMCALWAKPLTETPVNDCLASCLGENTYAVLGEEDFFYVVIKCPDSQTAAVPDKDSKEFTILRALEDAIIRIYGYQSKRLKKNKSENYGSKIQP